MTNQPAPFRIATVFGLDITEERVARYLPSNYEVLESDITGSAGDSVIEPEPTVWTDEADYRDSQASDQ